MKKTLILLTTAFLLCSCTTFGNFPNLKQGESTQEDVRIMLGEPASKRYDGEHEVWQYQFNKKNDDLKDKMRTNLNLDITFKEKAVDNYNLSIAKEAVKEVQIPSTPMPSETAPRGKGNFIKDLDKDNDGRVSRSEFPGPEDIFNNLDKNKDGFIDDNEAPQGQGPMQRPMPQGGGGRF